MRFSYTFKKNISLGSQVAPGSNPSGPGSIGFSSTKVPWLGTVFPDADPELDKEEETDAEVDDWDEGDPELETVLDVEMLDEVLVVLLEANAA
jgi:hypothetical protein